MTSSPVLFEKRAPSSSGSSIRASLSRTSAPNKPQSSGAKGRHDIAVGPGRGAGGNQLHEFGNSPDHQLAEFLHKVRPIVSQSIHSRSIQQLVLG